MAARMIRQSDVPFRKLRRKEEKQTKACKKTSWAKTAAKIAVSSALTGDPSGAVTEAVVGGVIDTL